MKLEIRGLPFIFSAHIQHVSEPTALLCPPHPHHTYIYRGKITQGLWAILPPKCKKEPSKIKNKSPENCHRLQCKSLFNVADLVNGM